MSPSKNLFDALIVPAPLKKTNSASKETASNHEQDQVSFFQLVPKVHLFREGQKNLHNLPLMVWMFTK